MDENAPINLALNKIDQAKNALDFVFEDCASVAAGISDPEDINEAYLDASRRLISELSDIVRLVKEMEAAL